MDEGGLIEVEAMQLRWIFVHLCVVLFHKGLSHHHWVRVGIHSGQRLCAGLGDKVFCIAMDR